VREALLAIGMMTIAGGGVVLEAQYTGTGAAVHLQGETEVEEEGMTAGVKEIIEMLVEHEAVKGTTAVGM